MSEPNINFLKNFKVPKPRPGGKLYKSFKILIVIFIIIILLIFGVVIYSILNGTSQYLYDIIYKKKKAKYLKNTTWLQSLDKKNNKLLIKDIVLPGTHNSSSYKIKTNNFLGVPGSAFEKIADLQIFNRIVSKWTLNQELSVYEQLEAGVRWLDFDITRHNKKWFAIHEFENDELYVMMNQIRKFMLKYNEPVFLNITPRDISKDDKILLSNYLLEDYSDIIFLKGTSKYLTQLKLNSLIKSKTKLAIIYNDVPEFWKTDETVKSNWFDTNSVSKLLNDAKDQAISNEKEIEEKPVQEYLYRIAFTMTGGFFNVMQTVLTPFNNFGIQDFNSKVNKKFKTFYTDKLDEQERRSVNIFTFDFIGDEIIKTIIDENMNRAS